MFHIKSDYTSGLLVARSAPFEVRLPITFLCFCLEVAEGASWVIDECMSRLCLD